MNRGLYSLVRHANLELSSPLPIDAYRTLLAGGPGPTPGDAIDIGCGKAALLIDLAKSGWRGHGIDRSSMALDIARRSAEAHGLAGMIRLTEGDAGTIVPALPGASCDLAICVGSSHACTSLAATFIQLRRIVRPGGRALVGELYWRAPPTPGLLDALGMQQSDLRTMEATFAMGADAGLEPLASVAASHEQFEAYESAQRSAGLAWCDANPEHPDAADIRARTEGWWSIYEAHTRLAFGFAAFLYGVV